MMEMIFLCLKLGNLIDEDYLHNMTEKTYECPAMEVRTLTRQEQKFPLFYIIKKNGKEVTYIDRQETGKRIKEYR